jgi:hypothetical protein
MVVRKSRSLHPNAEIDERARRLVSSQKGIFDKTNSNSRMKTASTRIAGAGQGPRATSFCSPHGAQRNAGRAFPDCAEFIIGRRFAPTRWLHPSYGCAALPAVRSRHPISMSVDMMSPKVR